MAKKIYFATVNAETIETINEILDVTFTHAFESKALYKSGKTLEKKIADLMAASVLGDDVKEDLDEAKRQLNIVGFKKKAIVAWRKSSLYNTKNDSDIWVDGLYTKIGVTKELAEAWAECNAAQTWGKWNTTIRTMLSDVYGMNIKDDKLVAKFASYLEHAIGMDAGSTNDILKGILVKDKKSFNKFAEVFVKAIATYMAKSCEAITIPTVEFYTASVEYDDVFRKVTGYSVSEKEDDKSEEDSESKTEEKSDDKTEETAA